MGRVVRTLITDRTFYRSASSLGSTVTAINDEVNGWWPPSTQIELTVVEISMSGLERLTRPSPRIFSSHVMLAGGCDSGEEHRKLTTDFSLASSGLLNCILYLSGGTGTEKSDHYFSESDSLSRRQEEEVHHIIKPTSSNACSKVRKLDVRLKGRIGRFDESLSS